MPVDIRGPFFISESTGSFFYGDQDISPARGVAMVTGGTAEQGVDFTFSPTSTGAFTYTIFDDNLPEDDETIIINRTQTLIVDEGPAPPPLVEEITLVIVDNDELAKDDNYNLSDLFAQKYPSGATPGAFIELNVLTNDETPLSIVSFTQPGVGVVSGPDIRLSFPNDARFISPGSFEYTVENPEGLADSATVTLTGEAFDIVEADRGFQVGSLLIGQLNSKIDLGATLEGLRRGTDTVEVPGTGILQGAGLGLDFAEVGANLTRRWELAQQRDTNGERLRAEHEALSQMYGEIGSKVNAFLTGELFAFGGSFAVGLAYGLAGGATAAAAPLIAFGVGAGFILGGIVLSLNYDELIGNDIKDQWSATFESALPLDTYIELRSASDPDDSTERDEDPLTIIEPLGDLNVTPGDEQEVFLLAEGAKTIVNVPGSLDGDQIYGFGNDDTIQLQGLEIGRGDIEVTYGSAILGIDRDGDRIADETVTLEGDFSAGDFMAVGDNGDTLVTFETFLPKLQERQAVDPDLVNGIINQNFLKGDGTTDFEVTLRDLGFAGYDNVVGVYEIDAGGNIVDTRILFDNANADKWASTLIEDVEDGNNLGFFIVQDAADWAATLSDSDTLSFIDSSGDAANISDGADISIAVNGAAVDEMVFHSFDEDMNSDGLQHALSGVEVGGEAITIGFEDLTGGGDRDYEDVAFRVELVDNLLIA